jgi:hypothetical protein
MAELAGLVAVTGTDPPAETPPAKRSPGVLDGVGGDPFTTTVASGVFFRDGKEVAVSPEASPGGTGVGVDESGAEGIQNKVTFGPEVVFFGSDWRSSPGDFSLDFSADFSAETVVADETREPAEEISAGSTVTGLLGTAPSSLSPSAPRETVVAGTAPGPPSSDAAA